MNQERDEKRGHNGEPQASAVQNAADRRHWTKIELEQRGEGFEHFL